MQGNSGRDEGVDFDFGEHKEQIAGWFQGKIGRVLFESRVGLLERGLRRLVGSWNRCSAVTHLHAI